jgi:tetratricopeptide (TPR) repeat protein/glycosyltransferase involved in cell wall biosynthesis
VMQAPPIVKQAENNISDTGDLFKQGEKMFEDGRSEEARQCFLAVIERYPDKEALNNLGVIYYQQGDDKAAIGYLLKSLSLDPYYIEATLNLTQVLRKSNQLTSIAPLIKKQVRYNPRDREIREILDEIYLLSSQHEKNTLIRNPLEGEAFFVLSTGNCGTLTMAELLRTATNASVFYYPDSSLEQSFLPCYWGEKDRRTVLLESRIETICEAWKKGLVYGETTPAVTPYWDILAREIPRSKFIILVRDPFQFVHSGLFQNYYQGHPSDANSPRPAPESQEYGSWKKLSQIEKICWLWQETYGYLNQAVASLQPDRLRIVHFEELMCSTMKVREIFDFLSLKSFQEPAIKGILKMRHNSHFYGHFPDVAEWSSTLKETVRRICGPVAQEYGYNLAAGNDRNVLSRESNTPHNRKVIRHQIQPTVSIGMPLYSGGTMLAQSIESFLSQDFSDFEIVISDHGSDPFVREIAHHYEKLDHRIKYFPTVDRISCIGVQNFFRVVELSSAPFFIWGSYDDRVEKSYIKKCLDIIRDNDSIVLAYTKSKVYRDGKYLGFGNDSIKADQDDPCERFTHVIWELTMCNAFYGLFRREMIRKTRSFRKDAYAHDNLFLAEIALIGKIIQIDDQLFVRNLTRNYQCSFDEHHTDMIRSMDPPWLEEGITLPFCRLTYAHCELINYSSLPFNSKERLTREILRCFRDRWDIQLRYEINRAIQLINKGCFYYTWDGRHYSPEILENAKQLQFFHVTGVIKTLDEAIFIYPEWEELKSAHIKCHHFAQELSLRNINSRG